MASNVGIGVVMDTRELKSLSLALRRVPLPVRKAVYASLRTEAKAVASDATGRASFSRRIPGSIKVRGSGLSVKIQAGGEAAVDAAPIENEGKGFVRHPVHGHMDRWTSTNSRPAFLNPALEAHRQEIVRVIEESVVAETLRAIRGI